MTLEETTQLYASVLRQLLPTGGYDTSPNTEALAVDVYAHAKLLAQADFDGKHLLKVLEELPPELLPEYEIEYGLPLKCSINAGKTIEERIELLKWVRSTRNVLNRAYFDQVLKIFGVELFEFKKFKPMQCTAPCNVPVNTEQLRYKIRIVIPDNAPADIDCIIENYFPGYLRIDVLKVPLLFKTSKPYPLYFIEQVVTDFIATGLLMRDMLHLTSMNEERVATDLTITAATIRTLVNETHLLEQVETGLKVISAVVATPLRNTSMQESVNTGFNIVSAVSKDILIKQPIDVERISTAFTVTSAIIN